MPEGLFGKEVIDTKRGDWCRSRNTATPLLHCVWSLLALALAGPLIAFLVFGRYICGESVTSQLVLSAGLINLTAIRSG